MMGLADCLVQLVFEFDFSKAGIQDNQLWCNISNETLSVLMKHSELLNIKNSEINVTIYYENIVLFRVKSSFISDEIEIFLNFSPLKCPRSTDTHSGKIISTHGLQ